MTFEIDDFDCVFIDPPRKGMSPELTEKIAKSNLKKLVYVSCDPTTLARDAKKLIEAGFELGAVTPVDMFPRTGHVESVVCLTRK
jgi:23S rRNA (uracil1939-C5)-methyltransferase